MSHSSIIDTIAVFLEAPLICPSRLEPSRLNRRIRWAPPRAFDAASKAPLMKPWNILCGDRGDHLAYMKAVGAWVQASLVIFHEAFELSFCGDGDLARGRALARSPGRPFESLRHRQRRTETCHSYLILLQPVPSLPAPPSPLKCYWSTARRSSLGTVRRSLRS